MVFFEEFNLTFHQLLATHHSVFAFFCASSRRMLDTRLCLHCHKKAGPISHRRLILQVLPNLALQIASDNNARSFIKMMRVRPT